MNTKTPINRAEKPLNKPHTIGDKPDPAEEARNAVTRLKQLRAEFRHGWIELEDVKKEAPALIKAFDDYGKAKAKKYGVSHRKFSLSAFLR